MDDIMGKFRVIVNHIFQFSTVEKIKLDNIGVFETFITSHQNKAKEYIAKLVDYGSTSSQTSGLSKRWLNTTPF